MRTTKVLAKNLHAGMYLVERQGAKRISKHICELHVDRAGAWIYFNDREGFRRHNYKRTQFVTVLADRRGRPIL